MDWKHACPTKTAVLIKMQKNSRYALQQRTTNTLKHNMT